MIPIIYTKVYFEAPFVEELSRNGYCQDYRSRTENPDDVKVCKEQGNIKYKQIIQEKP